MQTGGTADGGVTKNGAGTLRLQQSMSYTGPLTINGSVTITIPSGSRWVIL